MDSSLGGNFQDHHKQCWGLFSSVFSNHLALILELSEAGPLLLGAEENLFLAFGTF